ncbi:MAG: type II toxin-antitoxin system PemK/MazF family toxin [Bacteroidia bacterium]|nr:type II toxin-antitoxin system PemK/MazF family toxin [Bacteroidia bacterium]
MDKLNFGDIILLKFPFSDGQTYKKRPALIINDFNDGDIIVCRITSQIYYSKHDVIIDNWEKSGLKLPSVIRVHKIATLSKDIVEIVIGQIDESQVSKIKTIFANLTE